MTARSSRKLAVILHADVVGSTTLVQRNEADAHERIRDCFCRLAELVETYAGRTHEVRGDAVVAEFDRASDAVSAALAFQSASASSVPGDDSLPRLRIGIALGEVIIADNTVTGTGVILAQRLEQLAAPGNVVLQGSVYETVPRWLPFAYRSLGEQRVKGFNEPVRAYAVALEEGRSVPVLDPADRPHAGAKPATGVEDDARSRASPHRVSRRAIAATIGAGVAGAVGLIWALDPQWRARLFVATGNRPAPAGSIAVLPLSNLSTDAGQDYFVDGMTEALIANLAKVRALKVVSRTSVMRYKNTTQSLPQIAADLGVGAVVEGSAILEDGRVHITAQLIDAASDMHLWAQSYDRKFEDALALQQSVALDIARQVTTAIRPVEERRLSATRRVNPATYEAYLRGMYYLDTSLPGNVQKGLAYLQSAVDMDPADPLAYAGLALGFATISHGVAPPPGTWQRARAAASRALELDPDLPEAYVALADVKLYYEWDFAGAAEAFEHVLELNPSMAINRYHHAWYLALLGHLDEAIEEHTRARELDPLNPLHSAWLGTLYVMRRDYDAAIATAEQSRELDPNFPPGLFVLGTAYVGKREYEEAIRHHEQLAAIDPRWKAFLGLTYAITGDERRARAILKAQQEFHARETSSWSALGLAILHAALGEADAAARWLAAEPHHAFIPWFAVDPLFTPWLRGHPVFEALLRRLDLPDSSFGQPGSEFGGVPDRHE